MSLTAKKKKSSNKYAIALIAAVSAVVITLLVPALGDGGMYFLFLTAIVFSTLFGDARSGAFAAALTIVFNFFLLYLHGRFPPAFADWLVIFAFGLAASFTVYICSAQVESKIARRLAESKYRMIFEDAITGIYETTLDGRYAAANPKLAKIFGYESPARLIEEAENLNDKFYVEPNRREEFVRAIEERGNVAGFESEIFRRGGERIWITENAVAVRDETGEIIGFQGTTIEITDRKKAEAALEKAREELEEKVAERTTDLRRANEILRGEIVERERIENELLGSQRQGRELSAHLLSVREEEDRRIAREVHDELGQTLIALKIDLTRASDKISNLPNPKIRAQIGERFPAMLEIVDAAMEKTRKIILDLRPGVLDELGLAAAVEWQVKDFQKRAGVKCELEINFVEEELNQDLTTAMFRILQECLTNITRHSGASKAKIRLKKEDERLILRVEDDGRGISAAELEKRNSFGIMGMRERASLLGGTLEIERIGETGGTRVTIQIPNIGTKNI